METKTIKISQENYKWLSRLAGELQTELGEPVSLDGALTYIHKKKKLSDLAGSWKMSNKEAEAFINDNKKWWKKWNTRSV